MLAIAAAVVVAVIIFGLTVARDSAYTASDTRLLATVAGSRIPALVDLSLALDRLFSPVFAALIGLVASIIVYLVSRTWGTVVHFILLLAGSWLGSEVVKLLVHRPRPTARLADTLVPNPDPDSYPSGHACFAVGLGFAVFLLVARSRVRFIVAVLAVLLSLVAAVSRVYLGVHYPTDAVASLVYSAAALVGIEAIWKRFSAHFFRSTPRRSGSHRAH